MRAVWVGAVAVLAASAALALAQHIDPAWLPPRFAKLTVDGIHSSSL